MRVCFSVVTAETREGACTFGSLAGGRAFRRRCALVPAVTDPAGVVAAHIMYHGARGHAPY
jgi:hypothetical protein